MYQHTDMPLIFILCIIVAVVIYFSMLFAIWSIGLGTMVHRYRGYLRISLYTMSWLLFWVFIDYAAIFPLCLGIGNGYPFVNPLLPLMAQQWIKPILLCVYFFYSGMQKESFFDIFKTSVIYVKPPVRRIPHNNSTLLNPWQLASLLKKQMIQAGENKVAQLSTYVASEGTFFYALNEYHSVVNYLSISMAHDDCLLLGSSIRLEKKLYQAVCFINSSLIKKIYVKKIYAPFIEIIPKGWRFFSKIKHMLALRDRNVENFSMVKEEEEVGVDSFLLPNGITIIPRICLEFFFETSFQVVSKKIIKTGQGRVVIIVFVNDSWFIHFFKRLMFQRAKLKSVLLGLPMLYVGYDMLEEYP